MINGIINVNKEKGYTSHDVVAKLRGILRQKKIGHTGTLDPDATGVLPVCLGRGTKLCDLLTDKTKSYDAVLLLGKRSDTLDASGEILEEKDASHLTKEEVIKVIKSYEGDIMQVPPMYSALKVKGQKLCDLARKGITVERKARKVNISSIEIVDISLPRVSISVTCQKGTYIRTLCDDIGRDLNVGGLMESLVRTKSGDFTLENSYSLSEIEEYRDLDRLSEIIMPVDEAFSYLERVTIPLNQEKKAVNGSPIKIDSCSGVYRAYLMDGTFVGIYEGNDGFLKLKKMFLIPKQ